MLGKRHQSDDSEPARSRRRGGKAVRRLRRQDGEHLLASDWRGAYDGVVIAQVPDDATAQALDLTLRSTAHFATIQTTPLIASEEFTAVMEKVKNAKSAYTPPAATKQ